MVESLNITRVDNGYIVEVRPERDADRNLILVTKDAFDIYDMVKTYLPLKASEEVENA